MENEINNIIKHAILTRHVLIDDALKVRLAFKKISKDESTTCPYNITQKEWFEFWGIVDSNIDEIINDVESPALFAKKVNFLAGSETRIKPIRLIRNFYH